MPFNKKTASAAKGKQGSTRAATVSMAADSLFDHVRHARESAVVLDAVVGALRDAGRQNETYNVVRTLTAAARQVTSMLNATASTLGTSDGETFDLTPDDLRAASESKGGRLTPCTASKPMSSLPLLADAHEAAANKAAADKASAGKSPGKAGLDGSTGSGKAPVQSSLDWIDEDAICVE